MRASIWKRALTVCALARCSCYGDADFDNRPIPVPDERARMVQAEDCGEVIRFLAQLPNHVCINDLTISPTWNRGYVAGASADSAT